MADVIKVSQLNGILSTIATERNKYFVNELMKYKSNKLTK